MYVLQLQANVYSYHIPTANTSLRPKDLGLTPFTMRLNGDYPNTRQPLFTLDWSVGLTGSQTPTSCSNYVVAFRERKSSMIPFHHQHNNSAKWTLIRMVGTQESVFWSVPGPCPCTQRSHQKGIPGSNVHVLHLGRSCVTKVLTLHLVSPCSHVQVLMSL